MGLQAFRPPADVKKGEIGAATYAQYQAS